MTYIIGYTKTGEPIFSVECDCCKAKRTIEGEENMIVLLYVNEPKWIRLDNGWEVVCGECKNKDEVKKIINKEPSDAMKELIALNNERI